MHHDDATFTQPTLEFCDGSAGLTQLQKLAGKAIQARSPIGSFAPCARYCSKSLNLFAGVK
jgi:hypothetical protein